MENDSLNLWDASQYYSARKRSCSDTVGDDVVGITTPHHTPHPTMCTEMCGPSIEVVVECGSSKVGPFVRLVRTRDMIMQLVPSPGVNVELAAGNPVQSPVTLPSYGDWRDQSSLCRCDRQSDLALNQI
ncbi:unnamed protein product [Citrullus colocynthis]|uniref:Uncharacterized protein n=1 Tax=Citrullus colocynthis TaxID=252529 RepID=A0ABP0XM95_9ROSI